MNPYISGASRNPVLSVTPANAGIQLAPKGRQNDFLNLILNPVFLCVLVPLWQNQNPVNPVNPIQNFFAPLHKVHIEHRKSLQDLDAVGVNN
jgi:hypothetical protein